MPIGPSGSPLPTHVFRTLVPGTGLGFAITRSIVEGHAGRTGVESAEGAGNTFRVELPAAPAADPARGVSSAQPSFFTSAKVSRAQIRASRIMGTPT